MEEEWRMRLEAVEKEFEAGLQWKEELKEAR